MTESNQPRLPKPESLEAKFKLMTLLPYDKRAKRKHSLVFGFVLDWYHSTYGNALASVRHIVATLKERDPSGVGLYTGDVHAALNDLVAWGYLAQQKGAGRAASRYIPCWDLVCVQIIPNATTDEICVRENPNTDVRENPNTNDDSVHKIPNEDPSTLPGHQTRVHVDGNEFEAVPVAPPAVGLEATATGPASGEGNRFSEFWSIWSRKHGKKKAEAEWRRLAPDADLSSHIIVTARSWAAHYKEHGIEKKWIPEPANWLHGERWDEDLPLIHIDAKGAAISKAKANAPAKKTKEDNFNDNDPERAEADFNVYPDRSATATIVRAETDKSEDDGATVLNVWFQTQDGKEVEHFIVCESPDQEEQEHGMNELQLLMRAVGLDQIDDSSELIDKQVELMLTHHGRFVSVSRPWVPSTKGPRNFPKFAEIVNRTPQLGWAKMIGTAEDEEQVAA